MLNYLIFFIPPLLLALYAGWRVKSKFKKWDQFQTNAGMTGAEVARRLLDDAGLHNVKVESVAGTLTDHYDPSSKTLRLSDATYSRVSIAAIGVAAHEAGHAIQDKVSYPGLAFRSLLVPYANIGSSLGIWIIFGGMLMAQFSKGGGSMGLTIAWAGVALFSLVTLFTVITVPVEINASTRAREILLNGGYINNQEMQGVSEVLDAAALTYIAAAISSIATLMYYVLQLMGMSRDD